MADFDFSRLERVLLRACRQAFGQLRLKHAGEHFYCMGLYTSGEMVYLMPTAMSEEGLDFVVQQYRAKERYAAEPVERLHTSLRWSPCDSPYHLEGEEHFASVNAVMSEISDTIIHIDTDTGWDDFEPFYAQVIDTLCGVFNTLDSEGVFGTGEAREAMFVTLMTGDQDDSLLNIGRRVNPIASVERFVQEWDEQNQS